MFKPNVKVRQIRHVFRNSEQKKLEQTLSPFLPEKESFLRTLENKKEESCFVFTPNESVIEKDETPHIKFQEFKTPNKPKFHDIQGMHFASSKRVSTGAASPHGGSDFDCNFQFHTEGSEDMELPNVQVQNVHYRSFEYHGDSFNQSQDQDCSWYLEQQVLVQELNMVQVPEFKNLCRWYIQKSDTVRPRKTELSASVFYLNRNCFECHAYLQEGFEGEFQELKLPQIYDQSCYQTGNLLQTEGKENQILNPIGQFRGYVSRQVLEGNKIIQIPAITHSELQKLFNGRIEANQEKNLKLYNLPIILTAQYDRDLEIRTKQASVAQVPIKLKAVRGDITSIMVKQLKQICVPSLLAEKGQISQITEKDFRQLSLAILQDIANGTEERRLSKNDTELYTSMNQKAVYENVDSRHIRSQVQVSVPNDLIAFFSKVEKTTSYSRSMIKFPIILGASKGREDMQKQKIMNQIQVPIFLNAFKGEVPSNRIISESITQVPACSKAVCEKEISTHAKSNKLVRVPIELQAVKEILQEAREKCKEIVQLPLNLRPEYGNGSSTRQKSSRLIQTPSIKAKYYKFSQISQKSQNQIEVPTMVHQCTWITKNKLIKESNAQRTIQSVMILRKCFEVLNDIQEEKVQEVTISQDLGPCHWYLNKMSKFQENLIQVPIWISQRNSSTNIVEQYKCSWQSDNMNVERFVGNQISLPTKNEQNFWESDYQKTVQDTTHYFRRDIGTCSWNISKLTLLKQDQIQAPVWAQQSLRWNINQDRQIQEDRQFDEEFTYRCQWKTQTNKMIESKLVNLPYLDDNQKLWQDDNSKSVQSQIVSLPIINYYASQWVIKNQNRKASYNEISIRVRPLDSCFWVLDQQRDIETNEIYLPDSQRVSKWFIDQEMNVRISTQVQIPLWYQTSVNWRLNDKRLSVNELLQKQSTYCCKWDLQESLTTKHGDTVYMLPFSANIKHLYNSNESREKNNQGSNQADGYICSWKELEPVTLEKVQNEVHITHLLMNTSFWSVNDTELNDNQENTVMVQKQTETSYGLSNQYDKEQKGEDLIKLALVGMGKMIWKLEDQSYKDQNLISVPNFLDKPIWKSDDAIQTRHGNEQISVVISHLTVSFGQILEKSELDFITIGLPCNRSICFWQLEKASEIQNDLPMLQVPIWTDLSVRWNKQNNEIISEDELANSLPKCTWYLNEKQESQFDEISLIKNSTECYGIIFEEDSRTSNEMQVAIWSNQQVRWHKDRLKDSVMSIKWPKQEYACFWNLKEERESTHNLISVPLNLNDSSHWYLDTKIYKDYNLLSLPSDAEKSSWIDDSPAFSSVSKTMIQVPSWSDLSINWSLMQNLAATASQVLLFNQQYKCTWYMDEKVHSEFDEVSLIKNSTKCFGTIIEEDSRISNEVQVAIWSNRQVRWFKDRQKDKNMSLKWPQQEYTCFWDLKQDRQQTYKLISVPIIISESLQWQLNEKESRESNLLSLPTSIGKSFWQDESQEISQKIERMIQIPVWFDLSVNWTLNRNSSFESAQKYQFKQQYQCSWTCDDHNVESEQQNMVQVPTWDNCSVNWILSDSVNTESRLKTQNKNGELPINDASFKSRLKQETQVFNYQCFWLIDGSETSTYEELQVPIWISISDQSDTQLPSKELEKSCECYWKHDSPAIIQATSIFVNTLNLKTCSWQDKGTYLREQTDNQIQAPIWLSKSIRWYNNKDKMHVQQTLGQSSSYICNWFVDLEYIELRDSHCLWFTPVQDTCYWIENQTKNIESELSLSIAMPTRRSAWRLKQFPRIKQKEESFQAEESSDSDDFGVTVVKAEKIQVSDTVSTISIAIADYDLFEFGKDDVLKAGSIYKFKPGIAKNFVNRYVQVSANAFRYFRTDRNWQHAKAICAFRKDTIKCAKPIKVNKNSYIKAGSHIAKTGEEDPLFDNMFEIILNEEYEEVHDYREVEWGAKILKERGAKGFQNLMQDKFDRQQKSKENSRESSFSSERLTTNEDQESLSSSQLTNRSGRMLNYQLSSENLNSRNSETIKSQFKRTSRLTKQVSEQIEPRLSLPPDMLKNIFSDEKAPKSRNSPTQLEANSNPGFAELGTTRETELKSNQSSSVHLKIPAQQIPKLNLKKVFAEARQKKLEKNYDFVDFKQSNNENKQKNDQEEKKTRKGFLDLDLNDSEEESKSSGRSKSQKSASRRMQSSPSQTSIGSSQLSKRQTPVKVVKKHNKVNSGHLMAIYDKKGLKASETFIQKEFGKGDNNGKEAATWKNREKDWYNAERRFIFAAKTRKERDIWLEKINLNSCKANNKQIIEAKLQAVKEQSSNSQSKSISNEGSGLLSPLTEISITDQSKTTSPVPQDHQDSVNEQPLWNAMLGQNPANLRIRNSNPRLTNAKILSMVSKNAQEKVQEVQESKTATIKRTKRQASNTHSGVVAKKKKKGPVKKTKPITSGSK